MSRYTASGSLELVGRQVLMETGTVHVQYSCDTCCISNQFEGLHMLQVQCTFVTAAQHCEIADISNSIYPWSKLCYRLPPLLNAGLEVGDVDHVVIMSDK